MKIVVLDGYTENPGDLSWKGFEDLGELIVYDRTPVNDESEIIKRIDNAEIVITNKTPISQNVIHKCHNIKYIGMLSTGYNVVDIISAKEKRIPVCNIPTYGTNAVAQFAIGMLLEICHNIGHHSKVVKEGKWENCADWCFWDYPLIELLGKTFGVLGYGRIGEATANIARALGMNVIAYDKNQNIKGVSYVGLDELFEKSDIISLHCPLFEETEGIISKKNITKMKDGVIILNNSRGPLINEADLAEALNSGKVYAAGLDVVSKEPISTDNPLLTAKNCYITPHISWAPKESRARLMDIAVDNLNAFLKGEPQNIVNI